MPSDTRLRARYLLIMAEMAAQKAADEDALSEQAARYGAQSFGEFFSQVISLALHAGCYNGETGVEAIDRFIANNRSLLVV